MAEAQKLDNASLLKTAVSDILGVIEQEREREIACRALGINPTNTKLTALFDNTKVEGANGAYDKRNAWSIGAAQSFGKNTVGLEYGRSG